MEYYAQRTLYSELVGVLIKLAQNKFELQREDLEKAFGKEIASIGLYTAPQRLWFSLGIIRFVGQELQSKALVKRSWEIAQKKWKEVFGKQLEMPEFVSGMDEELKSALSMIIMAETKAALPEFSQKLVRERFSP